MHLEDVSAKDLILPQNFESILTAIKNLSGYKGPRKMKTPYNTLKLGFSLKTLADIASLKYLKEGLDSEVSNCEKFLMLYEKEYPIYEENAKAVYGKRKAYIPEELPEEEDIKKVRRYCIQEALRLCESIKKEGFTQEKYRQLAKVTLVCLITFNARRGGEPSKLQLRDWEWVKDDRWKRRTDIEKLSDPVEVTLANRLKLCYVEGKKKRAKGNALGPILFTKETVEAIDLLIEHRQDMGILPSNEYVFARGEGKHYMIGWDTLQAIAKQIDLKKPKLATPTRTRKWLATIMQLLDLSNGELTWLTNHMKHTKDMHMAWYRKEHATIELTKVAKVLSAIDEGEDLGNKNIDSLMAVDDGEGKCLICFSKRHVSKIY